jgi:hypothetical protein
MTIHSGVPMARFEIEEEKYFDEGIRNRKAPARDIDIDIFNDSLREEMQQQEAYEPTTHRNTTKVP